MELFRGAGVALITPFHEDKSVNYEMLEQLVERQIANGTDAIIVCGSTGEPATMSEEERIGHLTCCKLYKLPCSRYCRDRKQYDRGGSCIYQKSNGSWCGWNACCHALL